MMSEQFPYTFGKYQMQSEIGRGGFGTVFRALDVGLERPVAIKVLDPIYMRDQRWVTRFRQEAILMAKLDHPYIVTIHEIGEENGRFYIAMNFIDGPDLAKILRTDGPLPWESAVNLTSQVASALDYAHERKIIHRDLKPANVLIRKDNAILTDFGLARMLDSNEQSITMSGGVAGTFNYMPPEVFNNEDAGPAADVYALGLVFYEMITGSMLVEGQSTAAVITSHLKGVNVDKPLPEDAPAAARQVIQKAVAPNPLDRYSTPSAFAVELNNLAAADPPVTIKPEAKIEPDRPTGQKNIPTRTASIKAAPTVVTENLGQTAPQSEPGNLVMVLRSAGLLLLFLIAQIIALITGLGIITLFIFPIILGVVTAYMWKRYKPTLSRRRIILTGLLTGLLFFVVLLPFAG